MSDNVMKINLLIKEFSINKRFTWADDAVFTIDLHFYGDVHLKNWGRFFSYDDAVAFACKMINLHPDDPIKLAFLPNQPVARMKV